MPCHAQATPDCGPSLLQAKADLTLLGPSSESYDDKRARIDAMLSRKLGPTVQVGGTLSKQLPGGVAECRQLGRGQLHAFWCIACLLTLRLLAGPQDIRRQEQLGTAKARGSTVAPARRSTAGAAAAASPAAPATPDAASFFRQRPVRRRTWADLADELPAVVRPPVWPESLAAAAAAARADPAAAVAQILQAATPEGAAPISSLR